MALQKGHKWSPEQLAKRSVTRRAKLSKTKICPSCKMEKNREANFRKQFNSAGEFVRWASWCKLCLSTKEKNNRKRDALSKRSSYLKKTYGMTLEQFEALLTLQNSRCAICKRQSPGNLHVDHNHISGNVRGLLCGDCNRGLGLFKDSIENLLEAVAYLKKEEL